MMKYIISALILVLCTAFTSCQAVKPYQSQFINDYYMEQGPLSITKCENEGFSYREGASGGSGGKTGGGCGCN